MDEFFSGHSLFVHLLVGLAQYEDQHGYPYPTSLQYALNRLNVIAARHQEPVLSLTEWFARFGERLETWWRGDQKLTLPDEELAGIRLWAEGGLNAEVWEYVNNDSLSHVSGTALQEELDQHAIRDLLSLAKIDSQRYGEQYVRVRRFMIDHPVLDNWQFTQKVDALRLDDNVRDLLRRAYRKNRPEERHDNKLWLCPHCGSLLYWRKEKPHCAGHHICGRLTDNYTHKQPLQEHPNAEILSLKRGLVRRVCLPGKTEIKLFNQLVRLLGASNVTLYPHGDQYDIEIKRNGEIWAIDVKDYASPKRLARVLREEFPKQYDAYGRTWTRFLYVVPDYRIQWDRSYCEIVQTNFRDACVWSESDLLQAIKRR